MDLTFLEPGDRPFLDFVFPEPPEDRPYVYFNMVGSIDSRVVIEDTEQGLGSREDKRRMQELRAHADAVMNGAGTLRKSGASSRVRDDELVEWRREQGHQDQPLGIIITRRAEFELRGPYFQPDSGLHAIILATDASAERRRIIEESGAEVYDLAEGSDGLREAMRYLRQERGIRYLLCEGGPLTLGSLVRAGAADEFFLTRSPLLVGGPDHTTIFHTDREPSRENVHRMDLVSVVANRETDELYLRYRFAGLGALT